MRPDGTVWSIASELAKEHVVNAALRLAAIANQNTAMGTVAKAHGESGASNLNNPCNIDWSCWELLIALRDAGYETPQF